jgi:hypothetical protein
MVGVRITCSRRRFGFRFGEDFLDAVFEADAEDFLLGFAGFRSGLCHEACHRFREPERRRIVGDYRFGMFHRPLVSNLVTDATKKA